MKTMRGILKWTIRRAGRIGRVWRRRGVGGAEPGSGKKRNGRVLSYAPSQAKDQRIFKRLGCNQCAPESR